MAKKYFVNLSDQEREQLSDLISKGKRNARVLRRAQILLDADEGFKDEEIAGRQRCGDSTVQRTRQRYVEEGLEAALQEKRRSGQPEKLTSKAKAHLVALACSEPPEGHSMWTLRMLGEKLVELALVDSISHECVRAHLKKTNVNLGNTNNGALEK
jgi:transposase